MTGLLKYSTARGLEQVTCGSITTIGRDRSNQIVLGDLKVSRSHAVIRRLGQADYYFIDSGSSNGSRINQRRISTPTLLCDGDRITIGDTELLFQQEAQVLDLYDSMSLHETVISHEPLLKEITILVADIRGFTSLSEQLPIQTLTRVMTDWFNNVSDIIEQHRGVIDKFIGDCVFARWETQDPAANVSTALRTACLINQFTDTLTTRFPELITPLSIGAGINTGIASLGIGSDNTALGDSVNTAFRLESASKQLGVDIVLSESSYRHIPAALWTGTQRQLSLKGKRKSVDVVGITFAKAQSWLGTIVANAM